MKQRGRTIIEKIGGHLPAIRPSRGGAGQPAARHHGLQAGTFIVTGSFTGFHSVDLISR